MLRVLTALWRQVRILSVAVAVYPRHGVICDRVTSYTRTVRHCDTHKHAEEHDRGAGSTFYFCFNHYSSTPSMVGFFALCHTHSLCYRGSHSHYTDSLDCFSDVQCSSALTEYTAHTFFLSHTHTNRVFPLEAPYHRGTVDNSPGMSVNIVIQRKFYAMSQGTAHGSEYRWAPLWKNNFTKHPRYRLTG